jgi:hypothetical protein
MLLVDAVPDQRFIEEVQGKYTVDLSKLTITDARVRLGADPQTPSADGEHGAGARTHGHDGDLDGDR